jgi:NADH-quinone oxidoreductase subunit N
MSDALTNFDAATPELIVAISAMVLLIYGVFRGNAATRFVTWMTVGVLVVAGGFALSGGTSYTLAFNDLFVVDAFAVFTKS